MKPAIAIYPGSFDPLTNGHLDLIERGSKIFDQLIVAILKNSEKEPLFSVAERRAMIEEMTVRFGNVEVDTFEGLLVDYGVRKKATAVLRGIRAISDYEYELQMALMNRKLEPRLEPSPRPDPDRVAFARLKLPAGQMGPDLTHRSTGQLVTRVGCGPGSS